VPGAVAAVIGQLTGAPVAADQQPMVPATAPEIWALAAHGAPATARYPPYLHRPATTTEPFEVSGMVALVSGYANLLPVPDSCRFCERAGRVKLRVAPAVAARPRS
jgi:hypothetical protein